MRWKVVDHSLVWTCTIVQQWNLPSLVGLHLYFVCSKVFWHVRFTSLATTPFPKVVKRMGLSLGRMVYKCSTGWISGTFGQFSSLVTTQTCSSSRHLKINFRYSFAPKSGRKKSLCLSRNSWRIGRSFPEDVPVQWPIHSMSSHLNVM